MTDSTTAPDVPQPPRPVQDAFFQQLLKEDDIEWKSLLLEAVRSNQMDPWDIELSFIASQFLKMVREYQQMNFKLSGKVILASALLLKLKSHKFVNHDINALDALIASTENDIDEDLIDNEPSPDDDYRKGLLDEVAAGQPQLYPRTPQPRKRKVSVYDLIKALEQALEVNKRREMRFLGSAPTVLVPHKQFDITQGLNSVYKAIATHYVNNGNENQLTFFKLIPSRKRHDQVFTFIPLLHLRNMQKVDMDQQEPFGDFTVVLTGNDPMAALNEDLVVSEPQTAGQPPQAVRELDDENKQEKVPFASDAPTPAAEPKKKHVRKHKTSDSAKSEGTTSAVSTSPETKRE